jgi:hypothetical protein
MNMKELIIQVRIEGKQIATIINKQGFDDSASSALEVMGILQNLLANEQDKLKMVLRTTQAALNRNEDL